MKPLYFILLLLACNVNLRAQADSTILKDKLMDVVWLRGGSRLSGTILKWELSRGMEFQLATGAIMEIPKHEIVKVYQDVTLETAISATPRVQRGPRPYEFREHGMYFAFSGFLNVADPGGAGVSFTAGHRFNRMFSLGGGIGSESNDFFNDRDQIPVFAEVRGFLKPEKITPYYAFKLGYAFARKHNFGNEIDAEGGIYVSPEVGVRFGGRSVNYFVGVEYKLLKSHYTDAIWEGSTTDDVTYRRIELRTGILF